MYVLWMFYVSFCDIFR